MPGPHTLIHLLVRLALCTALAGCSTPDFGDSEAGLALEDLAPGLATSRLAAQTPRPARESISFMAGDEERAAGFRLVDDKPLLRTNYFLEFVKSGKKEGEQ